MVKIKHAARWEGGGSKRRASGAPGSSAAQITGREGLHKEGAEGKRISETTTGFFFLTGQNGSFFLFFRECNPSFHNSGRQEEDREEEEGYFLLTKTFTQNLSANFTPWQWKKKPRTHIFFLLARKVAPMNQPLIIIGWYSLICFWLVVLKNSDQTPKARQFILLLSGFSLIFSSCFHFKIITSVVGCFRTPQSVALWKFLALYNSG